MESLQPALYTTSAHVFQIDPETKKSWMPISKQAVPVAFYYDSESSLYKISSTDGSKTLINSTFYPGITFTKTSQKFGQWADAKLNTVYGLGFPNDRELNNFTDKFNEIKKNLRMGVAPILSTMVQIVTPPGTPREPSINSNSGSVKSISSNSTGSVDDGHQSPGSHRSSSSSSESQIKYENDRLKKALAQSSANAKKWESEFQTLKNNNARLTAALQESAINVEKWKEQLNNYKEENARLRKKVASSSSLSSSGQSSHDVNNNESRELEQKLRDTESKLRRKEEELNQLSQHGTKELILLREKNAELQKKLQQMMELERRQNTLSQSDKLKQSKSDNTKLNQVNDVRVEMEIKLRELNSLQQKMNSLFK